MAVCCSYLISCLRETLFRYCLSDFFIWYQWSLYLPVPFLFLYGISGPYTYRYHFGFYMVSVVPILTGTILVFIWYQWSLYLPVPFWFLYGISGPYTYQYHFGFYMVSVVPILTSTILVFIWYQWSLYLPVPFWFLYGISGPY